MVDENEDVTKRAGKNKIKTDLKKLVRSFQQLFFVDYDPLFLPEELRLGGQIMVFNIIRFVYFQLTIFFFFFYSI